MADEEGEYKAEYLDTPEDAEPEVLLLEYEDYFSHKTGRFRIARHERLHTSTGSRIHDYHLRSFVA